MKKINKEIFLGVIIILISLVIFINLFNSYNSNKSKNVSFSLNSDFNNVGSLSVGNDIKIHGVKVGEVVSISLDSDTYLALVTTSYENNILIPKDSIFKIAESGFTAPPYIEIELGASKEFFIDKDSTKNNVDAISLEEIINNFNTGFLLDIHGHGVNPDGFYDMRTWIGYLLTGDELDNSDSYIDQNISINNTSIYSLINTSNESLSNLIRGPYSLGSLFENNSFTALPSVSSPSPEGMRYFSGGYNTFLYGTNRNFDFNAIQLEFPFPEIRDTPQSRNTFSSVFVNIIKEYIQTHTSIDILLIE